MASYRIVPVDDHAQFRQGLKMIISGVADLVGSGGGGGWTGVPPAS